ncbi:MerR family transcriptional regulator [Teichococcus aestuarii]|uniref:hypothetical protein n=1 Tax=Teichococcus aestuarii TaxID=568898 RepID=UPI00360BEC61
MPAEFRQYLADLHWKPAEVARVLGVEQITVRRWSCGTSGIPPEITAWMQRIAAEVRAVFARHPVPVIRRSRAQRLRHDPHFLD